MRLFVVSNRVSLPGSHRAGGMAVGIDAAMACRGGVWVGWSGAHPEDGAGPAIHMQDAGPLTYLTVDLPEDAFRRYYTGFANQVMWPALHGRQDLVAFERADLSDYLFVNRLFAGIVARRLEPDDVVWVHDYHLFPLAEALRRRGVRNRIGFFLHTPFGTPASLRALPVRGALARWLDAYDVLGLQTEADAAAARTFLGGGHDGPTERRVFAVPIGIETRSFADTAAAAAVTDPALATAMKGIAPGTPLVAAVDRIDYSKGIPERIEAFSRCLECGGADRPVLVQVAVPCRTGVPAYRAEEGRIVEALRAAHERVGPEAIRLLRSTVDRASLAALYRRAQVGLVTPLRDGMNLVAKEYVAAQDGEDPGVLVLSPAAGAAAELSEGALLADPEDAEAVARAVRQALAMPLAERRLRWRRMMDRLEAFDATRWASDFLAHLSAAPAVRPVRPQPPAAAARRRPAVRPLPAGAHRALVSRGA